LGGDASLHRRFAGSLLVAKERASSRDRAPTSLQTQRIYWMRSITSDALLTPDGSVCGVPRFLTSTTSPALRVMIASPVAYEEPAHGNVLEADDVPLTEMAKVHGVIAA
jgi:hypothetical protein